MGGMEGRVSEMIERVARAIWKHEVDGRQHDEPFKLSWYKDAARVSMRAMREPTLAMTTAGKHAVKGAADLTERQQAETAYVCMIDEALKN